MMWLLVAKTWRDHWKSLLSWAGVIVAMTTIQLSVFPSITKTADAAKQFVDAYPEAFKKIFRMEDYTSGPGFLSTELFSLMLPLVLIAVGATWGASATAEEEEKGTADLLFTLPISRSKIVASKMVATLTVLLALGGVIFINLYIGAPMVDLEINFGYLIAATANVMALGALFSGVAFLLGSFTGKKGVALGATSGAALLAFVFYSLAPLVDKFDSFEPINPFQWALGGNILFDGPDWFSCSQLLAATAIFYLAAILIFNRKDIKS
jgi:ABC-2 type transport system permease protein